jgi:hypothetical protein
LEKFPEKVFTENEVKQARDLIEKGYRHHLKIKGSTKFKKQLQKVLELIKTAGDYDFLRTYIRQIEEIEGLSQLHESDAMIWANMAMLADPVDAASYIVQKGWQMKDFIEGKLYYGTGEMNLIEKRQEFLEKLKKKSKNEDIKKKCDELLKRWSDSAMMFP